MSFGVTKDLVLQKSALQFLYNKYSNEEPNESLETVGGILSNLNYAWLVNGSRLIIVSCKNGTRVGSWDFGNTLQDASSEIIGIDEIQRPHGKEPLLAISINCDTSGGIICIFDFIGSKVVRALQIGEHISSLHVIDSGQDIFNLSGPLRNFDGIFAVGTVGGNVYIIDICWQLCYEGFGTLQARDELNPCQMQIVTFQDLEDIENHKKAALRRESHLTIHLNVVYNNTTQHFVLKEPSGADKVHVNKQEVLISALHYCPQLGSILVGYNFGAFQLWDLMSMKLIYTSPICDDHVPISKFAIQEPADDPRAFCYIWAVYSSDDLRSSLLPYLVMYALCYESKEFHESHGILYENFQYCAVRFHMELGFNNQSVVNPEGGKCLKLESLVHKNFITNRELCISDGSEDVLSLCVIIWKALCENGQFTYMAVFDLNQWYKAQMPNNLNFDDCSSYMITLCVTDLVDNSEGNSDIYDMAVNKKSIHQFMGTQRMEEHYHPSSLSFDTYCLLENKSMIIQYQGIQKTLLHQLQTTGPLCLIRPTEIYQEIVSLGLTPLPGSSHINLNDQREVILNVALEQQLVSWLCRCASEWANGSFSSTGCSLELLISWAFRRGLVLKNDCDNICVPLFDYSEVRLDTNTANILNNCIRQIKNISFFHSFVMKNLSAYVVNKDSLSEHCQILQMVEVYFDVLQWLFNVGLLPEYAASSFIENMTENRIRAPYPADNLAQYYRKRRSELLLSWNKRFFSKTSILFIDNLIEIECGGEKLWKEWKNDGGDGFYPPMSLQALLRTYLMDNIEVYNKHSVVIYLFLDLAMILDPKKYASVTTHLIKFPAVFKVSPSLIKITQAFWQLDHGDFSTAMEQLLDPLVNQDDLKYWHHKVALKSLLVQEQPNSALLYMHVRKPPILDDEDVLCSLSLFVSNNMLDEAFYLEKHYKNYFNSKIFIKHLFTECSNFGRLGSIIYRNLSDEEENIFLQYLDNVNHPEAADLKITYFMQRSHYIEAFKTYQNCAEDPAKKGLVSRLKSSARDQIIHSYKKLLPTVSFKFIESCTVEPNPTFWKEVSRPEPMSVTVHGTEEKPEYKSSLIYAALAKAKQTFNGGIDNDASSLMNATTEQIPFLRTPTLPSTRKRLSVQVIIPKVITEEEEDGPSPKKRSKLSPKFICQLSPSNVTLESSILNTPIITRKQRREISPIPKSSHNVTATPTSILKVRQSYVEESLNDNISLSNHEPTSSTILHSDQGMSYISGRKSISRSIVRFDVSKTSMSSEEQTSSLIKSTSLYEKEAPPTKLNDSPTTGNSLKVLSRSLTPKNVSDSDDVFYSPNSSLNNIEEIPKDEEDIQISTSTSPIVDIHVSLEQNENIGSENQDSNTTALSSKISPKKPATVSEAKLVKLVDYDPSSSSRDNTSLSITSSLSARKSYRKFPSESTSSTPLNRNQKGNSSKILESEKASVSRREIRGGENCTSFSDKTLEDRLGSREFSLLPELKLKPRKSLSRKGLESNITSRLISDADNMDTSITKVFCSEQKDISTLSTNSEESEFTCSKIQYSDVYTKQLTTPEKLVEQHSIMTSFSSVREKVLDSDQSSNFSLVNTPAKSEEETFLSNSLMEELVENLRQRRCREVPSKQTEEEYQEKSKSPSLLKEKTPPRITRALSKRLSMERTISSGDNSQASTSERVNERRSEERTVSSSNSSFKSTKKGAIASPRITRRLSAELSILAADNSESSLIDEKKTIQIRASKRLSAERCIPSIKVSQSYKEDEVQVEILNFTSKSRISRRLSAERGLDPEDYSRSSNSKTEIDTETIRSTSVSKRQTPEITSSSINDSQSHFSDADRKKADITNSTTSSRSSRRLSAERTVSSGNESQSFPERDEAKIVPQRFSKRLSAERTIPSEHVSSPKLDMKLIELPKPTPKLKSRKSLGRQVLENNTLSRLMSEYQCSGKAGDLTEINDNQSDVEISFDYSSNSNSPSMSKNPSSPSDSLLEEIAFGQLTSEKVILHKRNIKTFDEISENKDEQTSSKMESETSLNLAMKNEYDDPKLDVHEKDSSILKKEDKDEGILEIVSEDPSKLREVDERNLELSEKDHKTSINQADITDDLETEQENSAQNVTISLMTEVTEDVDNAKLISLQEDTPNEENNENEGQDPSVTANTDTAENVDKRIEINEANNRKSPGQDEASLDNIENNEDFSIVYEDLSDESIKQNDPEMNIFEISDDLSLKESMGEEEGNFPESELTSDLNIMMQESPLPSVFERNIMYSGSNTSDENDISVVEIECSKRRSKLSSKVIDIGSSSEDGEDKSVSSQVSSKPISEKSDKSLSHYNSISTNSSEAFEKKHDNKMPQDEFQTKDIQFENHPLRCEEKSKINEGENEKEKSRNTEEDKGKYQVNENERELSIGTIENKSINLATPPSEVVTQLNSQFVEQPENKISVNIEEISNKKDIELQTGKSLLEIGKDDTEVASQTFQDDNTKKYEKDVIITPSRRMTRRRSKLLEESDKSDSMEISITDSSKRTDDLPIQDKKKTPVLNNTEDLSMIGLKEVPLLLQSRRSRLSIEPASPSQVNLRIELPVIASSSTSKSIKTYSRKRTRSVDVNPLETINEDSASTSRTNEILPTRRKLRSASVDNPVNREDIYETGDVKKTSSFSDVEATNEGRKSKGKSSKVVKSNLIQSYTMARRLTRRQSNILESTLKELDEEIDDDEIRSTSLDSHNRIELLDKSNFEELSASHLKQGSPDPEEEKIYETSPSSIGMSSSVSNSEQRVRRLSRSSSNASAHSDGRSKLSASKKTSLSDRVDSPIVIAKGSKIRLRSASTDEKDTVRKRRRSKVTTADENMTNKTSGTSSEVSNRSRKSTNPKRFGSDTVNKKISGTSAKTSRKRKGKSDLSEIKEEN